MKSKLEAKNFHLRDEIANELDQRSVHGPVPSRLAGLVRGIYTSGIPLALDKPFPFRYSIYMGRKLNLVLVEKTLKEKGFWIFAPWEFAQIFQTSLISAQKFLERYTKKGVFVRAKKGLYLFEPSPAKEMILANKVYFPSYVSLETALSYYNLIPETVYAVTSITTKPTREFEVTGRLFEYRKIKNEAFTGYMPKQVNGETGLIATPEKALVDYLYFVSLGKKSLNERMNFRGIDFNKIKNYSKLFGNPKLERIIDDIFRRN